MSHKVTTLVFSRILGSAVRKGVLSYMADRASDDGRGVWCAKQTIADETEFGRSTVIRTCNEFVAEGLLLVTGGRKCSNGFTVEYALNIDAIRALPVIQKKRKGSQGGTSPDRDPSRSGTPPVPERHPTRPGAGPQDVPQRDPNHPVTIHEPPMNHKPPLSPKGDDGPSKPEKVRLPENWRLNDEDLEYAQSLNIHPDDIQEIADDFHAYWTDRTDAGGKKSARGWRQTWRSRCRDVAPKFQRSRSMAGKAAPRGRERTTST
jgi:hypothetical protein